MLEFIKYNEITKDALQSEHRSYVSMVSQRELMEMSDILGLSKEYIEDISSEDGCRFESFDGFDVVSIQIMDANHPQAEKPHACIYMRKNMLILAGDCGEHLSSAVEQIRESQIEDICVDDLLYKLLDVIISDDYDAMERMEDNIAELEERVITDRSTGCVIEVMSFRRDLREMKKFYQQMYIVCEQMLENSNGVIQEGSMRYFKLLKSRYDRLQSTVLSLRDYVTQVRDAYQAQVDISQNNTMKFFTVITSIFLPLTLIAGWYGMNLKMPEFGWENGYLFVIIMSVLIVLGLVVYFRWRKWF